MIQCHNQYPATSSLERHLVKDEIVINNMKYINIHIECIKIKKKIQKSEPKSVLSSREHSSTFIPIDKANFKPRINPKIGPYCNYIGK